MTDENKQPKETKVNRLKENLESVGQMIVGEIEAIGGVLTGDPTTRAEGEFNVEVGNLHQQSNKVLTAIENKEETQTPESSQNETEK